MRGLVVTLDLFYVFEKEKLYACDKIRDQYGDVFMMQPIFLTEEECYCELDQFYANVAKHLGYDNISPENDTYKFNCTKICITPSIFEKIKECYMRKNHDTACFVAMLFVMIGPKMTVNEFPNKRYIAEVEDGFIVEDTEDEN